MNRRTVFACFVVILLVAPIVVDAGVNPDAVGLWLFDTDGSTSDVSGNGHDGVAEGKVKWVDGKFGLAVELDGASAIIVEHKDDMSLAEFTLMAWVNIPTPPTDWWTIAAKDGWPNRNYGIWLASGTGLAHHSFTSGAAPDNNAVNAVTPVTPNEWFHVAATYDQKTSRLYINGELDAEQVFGAKTNVTDVPFIVGRTANGSYKLVGIVDEVAVFRVALDVNDIRDMMNQGLEAAAASVTPLAKLPITWAHIRDNTNTR